MPVLSSHMLHALAGPVLTVWPIHTCIRSVVVVVVAVVRRRRRRRRRRLCRRRLYISQEWSYIRSILFGPRGHGSITLYSSR